MKNLIPLTINPEQILDEITNAKSTQIKTTLKDIREEVCICYKNYEDNKHELSALTPYEVTDMQKSALLHCYNEETEPLKRLKSYIKENQTDLGKALCQYCGLNSPADFDHYLPKGIFPEFSVLTLNLLPCCPECNRLRKSWLKDGKRTTINLYFDNIPDVRFLNARISIVRDYPKVEFYVSNPDAKIEEELFEIIKMHIGSLNLNARFKERVSLESSEIFGVVKKNLARPLSTDSIKQELLEQEKIISRNRGLNYWKAALYYGMANSNDLLSNWLYKI